MSILVTGASGQLGSLVVDHLLQSYKGKIIAGSRSLDKLQALKTKGVELRKVDFDEAATTDEAFKNVDKLFIVSTDSLAVAGLRLKQHLTAIASAKKAGVKHIVYTSLTNADDSPISFAPDHAGTEAAIKASGISYTILRNNWYFENLASTIDQAKASKLVMSATQNGKVGFISRADCARTAAAVLLHDNLKNITLDVTAPQGYSYGDIAHALNAELTAISDEQLRMGLKQHGLPDFVIDLVTTFEKAVASGKMALTNNIIEELTGKRPQTLSEFLKM